MPDVKTKKLISDADWVRQSMMVLPNTIRSSTGVEDPVMSRRRINAADTFIKSFTTDYYKFGDTALGGSPAMNMPPQFSHLTDPQLPRYINIWKGMNNDPIGLGYGQWYSENQEELSTYIHFRFGIGATNSLWGFFSNFYSADDARWVRTGRGFSIGGFIGKSIGWVFSLRLLPWIMLGSTLKFFATTTSTKFMYLKPMMGTYWKYLNDIANSIGSDMELTAGAGNSWMKMAEEANKNSTDFKSTEAIANKHFDMTTQLGQEQVSMYNAFLPDIYQAKSADKLLSGINIFAMSTRYARMSNAWNEWLNEVNESHSGPGLIDVIKNYIETGVFTRRLRERAVPKNATAEDFLKEYYGTAWGSVNMNPDGTANDYADVSTVDPSAYTSEGNSATVQSSASQAAAADFKEGAGSVTGGKITAYETVSDLFDQRNIDSVNSYFEGAQADGSMWISMRINGKDSVSESFSNSVRESDIGSTINSMSSSMRNKRISFADGKLLDIPMLNSIMGTVGDIVTGAMDSLQISGVMALAGNAFADIPKHFDEASAQFNQMSFTVPLRAVYGNDLCRFERELLPFLAMLVGTVPRSTGDASYGQPFYCEWYCRGRGQSRFSIISGLEITRAVNNMPWTPSGRYRGIDLRVTLTDLSSIMHMPLSEVSGWTALNPTKWNKLIFPQDSSFTDYCATLACLGLSEQSYKMDRFKRNWHKNVAAFSDWFDPAARVNAIFDGHRASILTMFGKTARR